MESVRGEQAKEGFRDGLRLVREEIGVDQLSGDVYGYEVMKSIRGLQDGSAILKPSQSGPQDEPYPLEVHIMSNKRRYIVGYVSESDGRVVADGNGTGRLGLFMRRDKERRILTRISVERIGPETSYPDWLDM